MASTPAINPDLLTLEGQKVESTSSELPDLARIEPTSRGFTAVGQFNHGAMRILKGQ